MGMKLFASYLYLSSLMMVAVFNNASAQRYGSTFGLRLGNSSNYRSIGITAEQRLLKHLSLEGIIQSDFSRNTSGHLLIKKHYPLMSKRFNYHLGAGISAGIEESFVPDPATQEIRHTFGNQTVGADLMLGVELTVLRTVISVDYKPNFNISGRETFYQGQVGISVRKVLVKLKDQNKKKRQKARAKRRKERARKQEGRVPIFGNIFNK